jgi:hypothetical protein
MSIANLVSTIARTPGCLVHSVRGVPKDLPEDYSLSAELTEFYSCCGGLDMFIESDFGWRFSSPDKFGPSTPIVLGKYYFDKRAFFDGDITNSWFLIAKGIGPELSLSIDLHPRRSGLCYNSAAEVYGTPYCQVVARSLFELLDLAYMCRGNELWWEKPRLLFYGGCRDERCC